ncbi:MAG: hypothetical protein WBD20_27535 [Pirellulaceae bacterium]
MPGQSGLTPVSSAGTLSPIRTTSGVDVFGGSLRVPPPPTGGFSVPNNYMGGTSPANQLGANNPAMGPAIGSGFVNNQQMTPSSVAPTGWVQTGSTASDLAPSGSFGHSFAQQMPAAQNGFEQTNQFNQPLQANALRPQSGGMQVHDLTQAPPPPGYSGPLMQQATGQYGHQYANQFNNQYSNQFNRVAPAAFNGQQQLPAQGNFNSPVVTAFPQGSAFRQSPDPGFQANPVQATAALSPVSTIASVPQANHLMPSQIQTREFDMKDSPLDPSWNGVSKFDDKPPSTEPVGSGFQDTADDLPWRRPDMQ